MDDLSKSLYTINNSYSVGGSVGLEPSSFSHDLSSSNLSKDEQLKYYKKVITQTKDIEDVYFFLRGISNMQNIKLDYHIIKKVALDMLIDQGFNKPHREIAEDVKCSQTTISYMIREEDITEEMAIRVIFTYNKQILKEIIK